MTSKSDILYPRYTNISEILLVSGYHMSLLINTDAFWPD